MSEKDDSLYVNGRCCVSVSEKDDSLYVNGRCL